MDNDVYNYILGIDSSFSHEGHRIDELLHGGLPQSKGVKDVRLCVIP